MNFLISPTTRFKKISYYIYVLKISNLQIYFFNLLEIKKTLFSKHFP